MAGKRNRNDVDAEIDLHGMTAEQLRIALQQHWSEWRRLHSVRIVHGQGAVLRPEIVRWCGEMGIPYLPDTRNAGALRIFPRQRTLPDSPIENTLRASGLRLTPEQEAALRDPAQAERARREEQQRLALEQQRRRAEEAAQAAQRRRDEALWQAEITRLGVQQKKRKAADGDKPRAPIVIPPLQLRYEEGYWRAELTRVADTDTETLQTQKKTGLDKLAPPMKEEKPAPAAGASGAARQVARRDPEAESALFAEEMERLGELDGFQIRRAKRED